MPKPNPLTAERARRSLAHRLGKRVDRIRQLATRLGIRPYRVFLVWTKFTGEERGEGNEGLIKRLEILPTPKLIDLSNVTFSPVAVGTLPIGAIRLERVSVSFTEDVLMGRQVPEAHEVPPEPYDFFYEVVEDGRGDNPAERKKFRMVGTPHRHAGGVHWRLTLERISEDMKRDGTSAYGDDD